MAKACAHTNWHELACAPWHAPPCISATTATVIRLSICHGAFMCGSLCLLCSPLARRSRCWTARRASQGPAACATACATRCSTSCASSLAAIAAAATGLRTSLLGGIRVGFQPFCHNGAGAAAALLRAPSHACMRRRACHGAARLLPRHGMLRRDAVRRSRNS